MKTRRFTLAITGASGAVYGLRLGQELIKSGAHLTLLVSKAGFVVLKEECSLEWPEGPGHLRRGLCDYFHADGSQFSHYAEDELTAPIASGSAASDAMIVAPCSMGSLSRIAHGNSGNLIERSADVMLKERRPLVLVPRETPLHQIHLENMLSLARLGAVIIPAMPAFYHRPASVEDMVDFVVGRIMDALGLEHRLFRPWGIPREDNR